MREPMSEYGNLSDEKLVDLLFTEEDRLPRGVVDEFVRREGMTEKLGRIVADPYNWNDPLPRWWAVVHGVYILGAIGTTDAVLPLLRSLRYADACENDWVTEELPAIFGMIGIPALEGLKVMAADRTGGWLTRAVALEGLAAIALSHGEKDRELFDFISAFFLDVDEDRTLRQMVGHVLLDFLRNDCRADLAAFGNEEQRLADHDPSYRPAFLTDDVDHAFERGEKALERYTRDWLSFYSPDAMAERRRRWDEERRARAESPEHAPVQELCPFSTGHKRKKCCVGKVGLA
jgi:hypothetical protein